MMMHNQGGKSRTSDFRSTEVRRSTRSTEKYKKVQGSTEKYKEVQASKEKYREVQRNTEKYKRSTILFSQKQSKSVRLLGNVKNSVPTNRTLLLCF